MADEPDGRGPLLQRSTGKAVMSLFDPEVIYEDANLPDHSGETSMATRG